METSSVKLKMLPSGELFKPTHSELVDAAYRWLLKTAKCGFAFRELYSMNLEIPDAVGFRSMYSILVECKASRSDFLRDCKKAHRQKGGVGTYRYYLCPEGMIKESDLPEKWGLLYYNSNRKVRAVKTVHGVSTFENGVFRWLNQFEDRSERGEWLMMYTALRRLQIRGHIETIYDSDFQKARQ